MLATLTSADQEWLNSIRPELGEVLAGGDVTRMRRLLSHHIAEAEDPAAVLRVFDRFAGRSDTAGTPGTDST